MKLAQIQMRVGPDKAANLRHAEALLSRAADADMAVLPEMFCCPYDNGCFRALHAGQQRLRMAEVFRLVGL